MTHSIDQKIAQFTEGKCRNFRELYENFAGPVRGLLYRIFPQGPLDDAVQDVFVKVWKGLPRFEGRSSLKVWIFQIAHRVAIDALRQGKNKKMESVSEEIAVASEEGRMIYQDWVRYLLGEFSLEHRSVLVLFFMEELSLEEIAAIQEVPVGTVKSRLHYAKQKMQESLRREGVQ